MNLFEARKGRSVALLLDPDKSSSAHLEQLLGIANQSKTDYILVGGSLTFSHIDTLIERVRNSTPIPVILFPGNLLQLTVNVDAVMLLSLISGRNAELLIGNHVVAAPFLAVIRDKIIPTGYILIGERGNTSVEYMSQTMPIPPEKSDIAVATALAGEMLGHRIIYLEAGSGSNGTVPVKMISEVKAAITIPLAVGGGIRDRESATNAFRAGADILIIGNGCEKRPELLSEVCAARDEINRSNS